MDHVASKTRSLGQILEKLLYPNFFLNSGPVMELGPMLLVLDFT